MDQVRDRATEAAQAIGGTAAGHLSITADVSRAGDVESIFRAAICQYGRIDALVNCAGGTLVSLSQHDNLEERWDKTIDNDLKSVYLMSERAVVELARVGGGSIVNMGSIAGAIMGIRAVPYAAAKAGIIGITKSHARIYGAFNVRVNCVLPGIIETEMVKEAEIEKSAGFFSGICEQTPLRRWGEPSEIAELIAFLASERCAFLTGATIVVDGGASLASGPRIDAEEPFRWERWPPRV